MHLNICQDLQTADTVQVRMIVRRTCLQEGEQTNVRAMSGPGPCQGQHSSDSVTYDVFTAHCCLGCYAVQLEGIEASTSACWAAW